MSGGHVPVLLAEALAALAPQPGDTLVDATFGGGGYARAILEAADCRLYAIDRDPWAIMRALALESAFPGRLIVRHGRFGDLARMAPAGVNGVALDLGVSSFQLDEAERGFSFRFDAPLDMRMGAAGPSAADAVNRLPEADLADVLYHLGEEPAARRIARVIVEARRAGPIETTGALAGLVERATGGRRGAKTHPATKTFQALRMLVNDELDEIARALAAAETILAPGGRLVVVTFHSLEDRLVKAFLAERTGAHPAGSRHRPEEPGPAPRATFALAERKARAPGAPEIDANPRARSAKLRVAIRTEAPAQTGHAAQASPVRAALEALAC